MLLAVPVSASGCSNDRALLHPRVALWVAEILNLDAPQGPAGRTSNTRVLGCRGVIDSSPAFSSPVP